MTTEDIERAQPAGPAESKAAPQGDAVIESLEEEGAVYDGGAGAPRTGPEVIQGHLKGLPDRPGVYRMLGVDGEVLYVGKARSLRKRVANYANLSGHTTRILRMIMATASMVFMTTETETEALLLEANLIKQLKPRFNVLLRDDKSFPHILIREGEFPLLTKHRGAKSDKGRYFGPFASAGAVNRTLNQLQKAFLLRNCSDSMFENRTRPCLQYQIKRCAGPCVGLVSREDYAALVDDATRFLSGRSTRVQEDLADQMREASAALEFERAAAIRDRIRALTQIQSHQGVNPANVDEADVVALHTDQGQTCIQVFFFRSGQNWGNRAYFPRAMRDCEDVEILEAFLGQFYSTKAPPRLILLSHDIEQGDILSEALSTVAGRRVEILAPRRGEKRTLVEHAASNAREALGRKVAENAAQGRLLAGLKEAFDLPRTPQRIEVYDNSHIQGAHAVGGMIVAGADGFLKSQYRKFNIKSAEVAGDDFGMMREVMTRRFSRLLKEAPDRDGAAADDSAPLWPDIVLIDGGAGQLSATAEVFRELGVEVDGEDGPALIAVAKGEERDAGKEVFYRLGKPPKALPFRDPTLYFLQRLRDEAHRWAIGAHRQKRAKATAATPLDEIPGVGAARKRALLAHFGSAKAVSRAGLADLEKVDGVSRAMARRVYDFFHGGGEA